MELIPLPYIYVDVRSLFSGTLSVSRVFSRIHRVSELSNIWQVALVDYRCKFTGKKKAVEALPFGNEYMNFWNTGDVKNFFSVSRVPILVGSEREAVYRAIGVRTLLLDQSTQSLKDVYDVIENMVGEKVQEEAHKRVGYHSRILSSMRETE